MKQNKEEYGCYKLKLLYTNKEINAEITKTFIEILQIRIKQITCGYLLDNLWHWWNMLASECLTIMQN